MPTPVSSRQGRPEPTEGFKIEARKRAANVDVLVVYLRLMHHAEPSVLSAHLFRYELAFQKEFQGEGFEECKEP